MDLEAIINIRGVGAGSGDTVLLSTQGSMRLVELFESSARKLSIKTDRAAGMVDLSVLFDENVQAHASEGPNIGIYWDEWWDTGGTIDDNMDTIDLVKLQEAGEVLSLGAMILGYELNY